ncbi:hypothetical protein SLA2020_317310 [Shorea laevis]
MDSSPENHLRSNQRRRSVGRTRSETSLQVTSEDTHFDQSLESFFARLNVSPHSSRRASYPGLGGGEFADGSGRFTPVSHGFLQRNNIDELGGLGVTDAGFGSSGVYGLQNLGLDGGVTGSNVDGWDSFVPDSYQPFLLDSRRRALQNEFSRRREFHNEFSVLPSLNRHGFLGGVSMRVPRGVNSSFSDNKNIVRSNLDNLPSANNTISPHWLQEPLNYLAMEDLRGNIVALAKDQYGCSLLKKIIDEASSKETIDMIFFEVLERVGELMVNPFSSHVVQKLIETCSEEQRTQILLMITKNEFELVSICINMHGTRAVQKLLHGLTNQQQISILMSALSPRAVSLTKEMNGHHVLLHCLKNFSDEDNKYLLNQIADNCLGVATDKSGCCVLQQCVEYATGDTREYLVGEIIANALLLAEDCYGNYVLQHLLHLRVPEITNKLLRQLGGSYLALSCNKYGSNVVEKCLMESGEQNAAQIIMELLNNQNASMLLLDPFGNYVIQSALKVSKGDVHVALLNLVWKNSPMMRSNIYGKKVLAWFEKKKFLHPDMHCKNVRRYPHDDFLQH